jgi:endonuclease/exonuclease/phosphatase family metal-dependent hydrolase
MQIMFTIPRPISGKRILLFINCVITVLYLLACLVPYLSADQYWYISILGLGLPFMFVLLSIFLIVWVVKKSKWFLLSFFVLLLSYQQLSVTFGFNFFPSQFDFTKANGRLRVLTWNVLNWDEMNGLAKNRISYRNLMMDAIDKQHPDVICLQEFFEPFQSRRFRSNLKSLAELGFSYNYFFPTSTIWNGEAKFGMAILSRFPIADTASFSFGETPHSEGLMYADIKINNQLIRVFSVHLESSRFSTNGYLPDGTRNPLAKMKIIIKTLRNSYRYRTAHAEVLRHQINTSPNPVILCGNLGDVPNSYTYFKVKRGLNDAFLAKGVGFGRTFRFISPTLRIDYILTDKRFVIAQYFRPKISYSDHYPIIVDLDF